MSGKTEVGDGSPQSRSRFRVDAGVAAIIAALIGAAALTWINRERLFGGDGPPSASISGTVVDCRGPVSAVQVEAKRPTGETLYRGNTDTGGRYSLEIPGDVTEVMLEVNASGFRPHSERVTLPVESSRIVLRGNPVEFGIGDGTRLDRALEQVGATLNLTVVFAATCTQLARQAPVSGAQVSVDDLCNPEASLRELTDRVKLPGMRYGVTELQAGRRYEVRCFAQ